MTAKIYLPLTESEDGDSTLNAGVLPMVKGKEFDESLACGACRKVIFQHVSTRTVYERWSAPKRLVVRCKCGAHNVIPHQVAPEPDGTPH